MSTTNDDLTPEEVELLNDLIRRAREESAPEDGPDDVALLAYIRGEATPEQRRRVQRALEASAELREDSVYLAGLFDRDVQKRYDEAPVPARPSPEGSALSKSKDRRDHPAAARQQPTGRRGWLRLFWGLPALAALLVVLLVGRHARSVLVWSETTRLTVDQLAKDPLRGSQPAAELTTARERAIWTLTSAVEWTDESVQARTAQQIWVVRNRIHLGIPHAGPDGYALESPPVGTTDREVWLLALPSLRLYQARLDRAPASVPWPAKDESDGVLTTTYRLGGKLEATAPVECRRR